MNHKAKDFVFTVRIRRMGEGTNVSLSVHTPTTAERLLAPLAGGMPLAVTQEDFLVSIVILVVQMCRYYLTRDNEVFWINILTKM